MKPLRVFFYLAVLLAFSLLLHIGVQGFLQKNVPDIWFANNHFFIIGFYLSVTVVGYFVMRGAPTETRPPLKMMLGILCLVQGITIGYYNISQWLFIAEAARGADTVSIDIPGLFLAFLLALVTFAIALPLIVLAVLYRIDKPSSKTDA